MLLTLMLFAVIAVSQASALAIPFKIESVDSEGDVDAWSPIATDANGRAHISYSDFTDGDLKYAVGDSTPPAIVSTDPARDETEVPINKTVSVTFSETIQEGAAFAGIVLQDGGGTPVSIAKSITGSTLTLDPTDELTPNTTHTVTIPAGAVQDLAGNPLVAEHGFVFATGAIRRVEFTDIPADAWYKPFVDALVAAGVTSGYPDGSFRPTNPATRAEASKMVKAMMDAMP